MKLFEVMYPECKLCGFDFSKGGRDHRFGVCDRCAFPDKKKGKVKEGWVNYGEFQSKLEHLLWQDYQQDPWMPAGETYPAEMTDEEYLEFGEHIRDIMDFAKKRRITDPQQAIELYHEEIVDEHKAKMMRH